MSICDNVFQKALYDLKLEDIINFFSTEQEETSTLEFKSGGLVSHESIYKEVCAFLNTEGGVLIIGAPEEKKVQLEKNKEKKVCTGDLVPSKVFNQDSLMRGIASNISPSPIGIKAKSFEYLDGTVIILEVSQSLTPPHQVSNEGKYYIRLERDAKAAPHGIVEALFQKRQRPNLNASLHIFTMKNDKENVYVEFALENESVITAENYGFIIQLDGVERFVSKKNLKKDIVVEDEMINTQDFENGSILVKGMKTVFELRFKPLFNFFYVSFAYYCKDTQVELKAGLMNLGEEFDFTQYFTSKEIHNDVTPESIYKYFLELRKDSLINLLDISKSEAHKLFSPADIDSIINVEQQFDIKLPRSYYDFLCITNGFIGMVGNIEINMYSTEGVSEESARMRIFLSRYKPVVIGEIIDYNKIIIYWDEEQERNSFALVEFDSYGDHKIRFIGDSLCEVLKKIKNWEQPSKK